MFRERERSGGHKRGGGGGGNLGRGNIDGKELARLLLSDIESGVPDDRVPLNDEDYQNLQALYDTYNDNDNGYG